MIWLYPGIFAPITSAIQQAGAAMAVLLYPRRVMRSRRETLRLYQQLSEGHLGHLTELTRFFGQDPRFDLLYPSLYLDMAIIANARLQMLIAEGPIPMHECFPVPRFACRFRAYLLNDEDTVLSAFMLLNDGVNLESLARAVLEPLSITEGTFEIWLLADDHVEDMLAIQVQAPHVTTEASHQVALIG
jgi:hypothetical protein